MEAKKNDKPLWYRNSIEAMIGYPFRKWWTTRLDLRMAR